MKLPFGVYAVSAAFAEKSGCVSFLFKGCTYQAQVGENAFVSLDDLTSLELNKPNAPFCGYGDTPVILIPSGTLKLGTASERAAKFRTYMPCAVTILGENAGISPNGADLRTPGNRAEETVLEGSFYFGCIDIRGELPGALTLDGVTLKAKIYDSRTGGENAALVVKNTVFTANIPYTIVHSVPGFSGKRSTVLQNCRAVGINSISNEGCLLSVGSGDVTVTGLYMSNTRKFLGMTNYSYGLVNDLGKVLFRDCLLENCASTHGLTINLPQNSTAQIFVDSCRFLNFVPYDDPAITVVLPKDSCLRVENSEFMGNHSAPAVLVDGDFAAVAVENTIQTGFAGLLKKKPARRSCPDNRQYTLDDPHGTVGASFVQLDKAYAGRKVYYGDFHCHSNSGGTSDGKAPIETYVEEMKKKQLDFAAIVDHKQMRHFFLDCWDEQYLICGTEPGQQLNEPGRDPLSRKMDYTMIFPDKTGLKKVVQAFPEFAFTGTDLEGSYRYWNPTLARFRELADFVYSIGGLLSHAHPKQLMASEDPMDYYIGENVPLETVHGAADNFGSRQNRDLWETLLKLGKRVKTHGSSDSHGPVSDRGLTAVYAHRHHSTDIFKQVRAGDCTAGGVAVRMCIGDTPMGGSVAYTDGLVLEVAVDGFHPAHLLDKTVYCLKVYTDKGLAFAREFDGTPQQVAVRVEKRSYYRAEITNESDGVLVALTNPIWLD